MVGKPNMQLNSSCDNGGSREGPAAQVGDTTQGSCEPPLHTPELCEQKTPADVSTKGFWSVQPPALLDN